MRSRIRKETLLWLVKVIKNKMLNKSRNVRKILLNNELLNIIHQNIKVNSLCFKYTSKHYRKYMKTLP